MQLRILNERFDLFVTDKDDIVSSQQYQEVLASVSKPQDILYTQHKGGNLDNLLRKKLKWYTFAFVSIAECLLRNLCMK